MNVSLRIAGLAMAASCAAIAASAQTAIAVHPEAGVGFEHIGGGPYDGRLGAMETAGGEAWFGTPNPSLMFTFGARAEYHTGPGTYLKTCAPNPGNGSTSCLSIAPNLIGGQEIFGARYVVSSRLTIGGGVGVGYLTSTDGGVTDGSYVRSVQGDVSYVVSDHVTVMGRAEEYQMPRFGNSSLQSRPVTLLMRFR